MDQNKMSRLDNLRQKYDLWPCDLWICCALANITVDYQWH